MKKIPTLFVRKFENHKIVGITSKFTDDRCKEAFLKGEATIKFDGSCCAIFNGVFFKRYDAKKGKPIPIGAIKCQEEPDPTTGHLPCWVPVDPEGPADKWFMSALNNYEVAYGVPKDGTYEAIGLHFQGNPYRKDGDILVPHGKALSTYAPLYENNAPRTFESVKDWLETAPQEGLVFWLDGEPVCKIKRTDFGFEWPIKEV